MTNNELLELRQKVQNYEREESNYIAGLENSKQDLKNTIAELEDRLELKTQQLESIDEKHLEKLGELKKAHQVLLAETGVCHDNNIREMREQIKKEAAKAKRDAAKQLKVGKADCQAEMREFIAVLATNLLATIESCKQFLDTYESANQKESSHGQSTHK